MFYICFLYAILLVILTKHMTRIYEEVTGAESLVNLAFNYEIVIANISFQILSFIAYFYVE